MNDQNFKNLCFFLENFENAQKKLETWNQGDSVNEHIDGTEIRFTK